MLAGSGYSYTVQEYNGSAINEKFDKLKYTKKIAIDVVSKICKLLIKFSLFFSRVLGSMGSRRMTDLAFYRRGGGAGAEFASEHFLLGAGVDQIHGSAS